MQQDLAQTIIRMQTDLAEMQLKLLQLQQQPQQPELGSVAATGDAISDLSDKQIQLFVDNELATDPALNLPLLPAFIERKLYFKVFKMALALVKRTVGSSKLVFMGHDVTVAITPEPLPPTPAAV